MKKFFRTVRRTGKTATAGDLTRESVRFIGRSLPLCIVMLPSLLQADSVSFGYTGQSQTWTVPTTGTYTITADGAEGGKEVYGSYPNANGGFGGQETGNFDLVANQKLTLIMGGEGGDGTTADFYFSAAGGGGGTFVCMAGYFCHPFLAAGGGGGGGAGHGNNGLSAVSEAASGGKGGGGQAGTDGSGGFGGNGGGGLGAQATGSDGYGPHYGHGGGGNVGVTTFYVGGLGGGSGSSRGGDGGYGGGGGGGGDTTGGGGGGGGYSGGGGGTAGYGGGAGASYNSGSDTSFAIAIDGGNGSVTITPVNQLGSPTPAPEPSGLALMGAGLLSLAGICWRKRTRKDPGF